MHIITHTFTYIILIACVTFILLLCLSVYLLYYIQRIHFIHLGLGPSTDVLEQLLTQRLIDVTVNNTTSSYTVRLNIKEAIYTRDACIKSIYTHLFDFIVNTINTNLTSPEYKQNKQNNNSIIYNNISILDIYGFETYEINTYEQFLINYANESLQNTFNIQIFDSELKLFSEENIICHITNETKPENNGCISLIANRNNSILSILDSICQLPQPSDVRFVEELHKALAGNR